MVPGSTWVSAVLFFYIGILENLVDGPYQSYSDVGGGYQRSELADIALFWMAVREIL